MMDDVKMGPATYRLLMDKCMGLSQEAFVSIVHSNDIAIESIEVRTENEKAILGSGAEGVAKDNKNGAVAEDEPVPFEPHPHTWENQILVPGEYSDVKEKLKAMEDIVYDSLESNYYI